MAKTTASYLESRLFLSKELKLSFCGDEKKKCKLKSESRLCRQGVTKKAAGLIPLKKKKKMVILFFPLN